MSTRYSTNKKRDLRSKRSQKWQVKANRSKASKAKRLVTF